MGCTASKPKEKGTEPVPEAAAAPPRTRAQEYMVSTAPSFWKFVETLDPGDDADAQAVRTAEWRAFVSTLDFLLARELEASKTQRREALELAKELCPTAPQDVVPDKVVDTSLNSLLEAWYAVADDGAAAVGFDDACEILRRAKRSSAILPPPSQKHLKFTFGDLLRIGYDWFAASAVGKLFESFGQGARIMEPQQLAEFLSFGSEERVSLDEVRELIDKRLGGAVTRFRFQCYFGSSATNDILDPKRALSVWQDMSQPLTCYSVATCSVAGIRDIEKALARGTRAFVLRVTADTDGAPMIGPNCSLSDALKQLKKRAFKTNPLPVILCFLPSDDFTAEVQDEAAATVERELADTVAAGLMFRGSQISDPKFTPIGLQNRFLIMAKQGTLKPFVGFGVADMQRAGLGVRVTSVPEGTPAARAGIGKQDWITHFNGEPIDGKDQLREKLSHLTLGEEFRVRKEGLTDICGVVGAAVADQEGISKRFSRLLFFNLASHDAGSLSSPGKGRSSDAVDRDDASSAHRAHLPWDASFTELPEDTQTSPASNHPHSYFPTNDGPDHFMFVTKASVGTNDTDERERAVADADNHGVQFIDTSSSAAAQRWSRGKFADNGSCGYILHHRPVSSQPSEASAASEGLGGTTRHSKQRASCEGYHAGSIHLEIELLGVPGASPAIPGSSRPKDDAVCAAAVIGTPERQRAPMSVVATVDVSEPSGKVLMLRTSAAGGGDLEAALPAALVRPGYRIINFVKVTDATQVFPVLCAVKRVVRSPARSPTTDGAALHS